MPSSLKQTLLQCWRLPDGAVRDSHARSAQRNMYSVMPWKKYYTRNSEGVLNVFSHPLLNLTPGVISTPGTQLQQQQTDISVL